MALYDILNTLCAYFVVSVLENYLAATIIIIMFTDRLLVALSNFPVSLKIWKGCLMTRGNYLHELREGGEQVTKLYIHAT